MRGDDGRWHDVTAGRLSTCHRTWSTLLNDGHDARLLLNGKPVRMRAADEQLDLFNED